MTSKALNIRNCPPDLLIALHERASEAKMHLREYCIMVLKNAAYPPLVVTRSSGELADAVVAVEVFSDHREPVAHIEKVPIEQIEPQKRFPKDVPILCTKCKKVPMRARDEKTWRCPLCGHQEER